MQRRGFIAAFGVTAIALPFVARAQQATPVVGLRTKLFRQVVRKRYGSFRVRER